MRAERGTSREEEEQRASSSSDKETGWETIAVGKLKVWKPQEESEYRGMQPRVVKNNSIVEKMWHSTGNLNLLPSKTILCFEKQALHLIILIATYRRELLAF